MIVVVFPSKAVADQLLTEIACTPVIEGQVGAVWVCPVEDSGIAAITYLLEAGNGRVAIAHPFNEREVSWMKAYTAGFNVQFLATLPSDWKYRSP